MTVSFAAHGWREARQWAGAIGGIVAFFISIAAYLKSSTHEDNLQAFIEPEVSLSVEGTPKPGGFLFGDITLKFSLLNSGDRNAGISNMTLLFRTYTASMAPASPQSSDCTGEAVALDFKPFLVKANDVSISEFKGLDRQSHQPGKVSLVIMGYQNEKVIRGLTCLGITVLTSDAREASVQLPIFLSILNIEDNSQTGYGFNSKITLIKGKRWNLF